MTGLEEFTNQYMETALWASLDDSDVPLIENYNKKDFSSQALLVIKEDCEEFLQRNARHIRNEYSKAGHDFWLTRNRHGAGFWDGDWSKKAGELLTKSAHTYRELTIIVGDDRKLHLY